MYYNYEDLNYINQELAEVWPGWTAVKLLGRGSFGAVYEINRCIRSKVEKAAMKVLRVPGSDEEVRQLRMHGVSNVSTEEYYDDLIEGIQNEITIMQKLVGNSHVVSYEDYSINKRQNGIGWDIYIRMELLTPLTEYMEMYLFDETAALRMARDIALGLRDCHKNGILHRDIKPQNIFINDSGSFKLGDFGVSKAISGSQASMSFRGTLSYMPPEVFRMESTDERSDIYSLGLVLYQWLNDNRLPFLTGKISPESIENARLRRFTGEPVPEPARGSEGLKAIALKAISADPRDRFRSASEMYRALMSVYKTDYSDYYQAEFREEEELNTDAGAHDAANANHPDSNGSTKAVDFFADVSGGAGGYNANVYGGAGGPNYDGNSSGSYLNDQNDQPETKSSVLLAVLIVLIIVLMSAIVAAGALLLKKPSNPKAQSRSNSGQAAESEHETAVEEEARETPKENSGQNEIVEASSPANEQEEEDSYKETHAESVRFRGNSKEKSEDRTDSKEPLSPDERGYLGVSITTITPELSEQYNMPVGAYVAKIFEGSGAANSDLRVEDIITGINGQTVTGLEDITNILQYLKPGRKVTLTVMRKNSSDNYSEHSIELILGTRDTINY